MRNLRHITALLLGTFSFALFGPTAPGQTASDSDLHRPDVVERWSDDVLRETDRKLNDASRAVEILQQLCRADVSSRSRPPAPDWPNAYADVLGKKAEAMGLLQGTASPALDWLGRQADLPQHRANAQIPTRSVVLDILRREGLPDELMAVASVESGFNPLATSPKGARGIWQLMPATALRFGLNPTGPFDERFDPVRSTRAAARYLKELYGIFGDWALALAAYNAGEDRVRRALSVAHAGDFWSLSRLKLLPEETRRYVPLVMAAQRGIAFKSFMAGQTRFSGSRE